MRRLALSSAVAAAIALAVATTGAGAPVATPISPSPGQAVLLTPPAGFANGDVRFTWSIVYDCPGPASIHSSYIELREPGDAAWRGDTRDGPYLGDGQFTLPSNFFPTTTPARWEWRVFWACGATTNFAGAQGTSAEVPFTVALPPCSGLEDSALVICRSKQAREARLKACATRATAKKQAACRVRARALHARTVRLQGCAKRVGKKRAACIRAANRAYRRAIG